MKTNRELLRTYEGGDGENIDGDDDLGA